MNKVTISVLSPIVPEPYVQGINAITVSVIEDRPVYKIIAISGTGTKGAKGDKGDQGDP